MLPSAIPSPPGNIDTAPAREEKANTKVADKIDISKLNPLKTYHIATHSKNHDITLMTIAIQRVCSLRRTNALWYKSWK